MKVLLVVFLDGGDGVVVRLKFPGLATKAHFKKPVGLESGLSRERGRLQCQKLFSPIDGTRKTGDCGFVRECQNGRFGLLLSCGFRHLVGEFGFHSLLTAEEEGADDGTAGDEER